MSDVKHLTCQFCGESNFDHAGLKSHLLSGDCQQFEATENIQRLFTDSRATVSIDTAQMLADAIEAQAKEDAEECEVPHEYWRRFIGHKTALALAQFNREKGGDGV